MTLSSKVKDSQLVILEGIKLNQPKTKEAAAMMSQVSKLFKNYKSTKSKKDSVLAVVSTKDRNLEKSFSNLSFVTMIEARNLNPLDVLKYKYLLMTKDCPGVIENTFKAKGISQKTKI